ncbi:DUF5348 domain-containing protein [Cohnella algarum]|nr:DUF5348 domain-containing protein [Cohnella algarum]
MNEIRFHGDTERWNVYDGEELLCSLRCGDAVMIQVGKHFLPSNLELDTDWYVKFGKGLSIILCKLFYRHLSEGEISLLKVSAGRSGPERRRRAAGASVPSFEHDRSICG